MPSNTGLGELRNHLRMFGREVLGFAPILFHVKEFGFSPVILAEEFPFTIPHGQVRQVLVPVIGIAIWRAAKINRCLARSSRFTQERTSQ